MLKDLFQWYLDNQAELVKEYEGKYLVIKDNSVVGAYTFEDIALNEATKNYGLGNFIIQLCTKGDAAYTHTFHSRVVFV